MSSEVEQLAKEYQINQGFNDSTTNTFLAGARAVLEKARGMTLKHNGERVVRLSDLEAMFEEKERGAIDPLVYNPDVRPVPKDYDTSNAVGLATLLKEKKGA